MKKIIVALLLIFAMCLSFAACAPTGNSGNGGTVSTEKVRYEVPAEGYDGSEVTITFSHTMNQEYRKVLDRAIERFNEIYPNITVEHTQVGGYDELRDAIKTELTAGNQPNIAYCYPDHVALYNITKKVVPLDNFIESTIEVKDADGNVIETLGLTQEQIDDYIPGYYKEGAVFDVAGTMYTMPMSKSTEVLYYNKTFFEDPANVAKGLKVPTTWAEMEEACRIIKEIDPNCYPLGYDSEANWFITMCEQQGSPYTSSEPGKYFLFNDEANIEFVKMFRGWYDKGYVTTKDLSGGYTSDLFKNTNPSEKSCYMCIGSTGGAAYQIPAKNDDGTFVFDAGITSIPTVEGKDLKVISQGPSLCIFDSTNKQEVVASWLFVKFLTTEKEFQAAFSMTSGYMPVIQSIKDEAYAEYKTDESGELVLDNEGNKIPVNSVAKFIAFINGAEKTLEDGTTDTVNMQALAVKRGLETADAYFVSPAFNGSSLARDQVGALLKYCLATPTDNIDKMIRDAFTEALAACWKNS